MSVTWIGSDPSTCQICNRPVVSCFVDGKTYSGPWATMCLDCHFVHGVGIGLGKGQIFTLQADGSWLKTGG